MSDESILRAAVQVIVDPILALLQEDPHAGVSARVQRADRLVRW